jgi:hypothetical protein
MKTLITMMSILLMAGAVTAAPGGIPGPPWLPGEGGDVSVDTTAISEAEASASSSASVSSEVAGNNANLVIDQRMRLPASSAADLMLANCQKGASAQAFGGGGSFGSTDEVCHLFGLYALREARGERAEADQILEEITDILKIRTNPVRRFPCSVRRRRCAPC